MDSIRCLCKKEARRVLVGSKFIYYDCEGEDCGFEKPLCHCKKSCQLVTSQSTNRTRYFICSNFVIACCNCNKICNIKISRSQLNPGLIFWSCKQYPNGSKCDTWVPIQSSLTSHFPKINYLEFVCNLWTYMIDHNFKGIFASFITLTEYKAKDLIGNIENEVLRNEIK